MLDEEVRLSLLFKKLRPAGQCCTPTVFPSDIQMWDNSFYFQPPHTYKVAPQQSSPQKSRCGVTQQYPTDRLLAWDNTTISLPTIPPNVVTFSPSNFLLNMSCYDLHPLTYIISTQQSPLTHELFDCTQPFPLSMWDNLIAFHKM